MELAGVAGLVFGVDLLDGQLGVSQCPAQTNPTFVLLLRVVAVYGGGGHSGGVALLGRLPPQHLADPLGEAVPTGQGDRLATYGRPIALQVNFT